MQRIIKQTIKGKRGGKWFILECNKCHKEFKKDLSILNISPCLFCSHSCSKSYYLTGLNGEKSPSWKGGRHKTSQGYIKVIQKSHPHADPHGYVFEHRLRMEEKIGRLLKKDEFIHHINHIKNDNRIDNLMLIDKSSHHSLHMKEYLKYFRKDPLTGRFVSHKSKPV